MIIRETGEDDLGQVMTIIRMAQQSFRDQGVDRVAGRLSVTRR